MSENKKRLFEPILNYGIPEITATQLHPQIKQAMMIDVRRPDEFVGQLGHIPGAQLIEMGPDLETYLQQGNRELEIVFVCRSGARSGRVTEYAQGLGYNKCVNLQGGMIHWNEMGFIVSHEK